MTKCLLDATCVCEQKETMSAPLNTVNIDPVLSTAHWNKRLDSDSRQIETAWALRGLASGETALIEYDC